MTGNFERATSGFAAVLSRSASPVREPALAVSLHLAKARASSTRRRDKLESMDDRRKLGLKAATLTLLPAALLLPMLAAAHFGPTGPASVWPVLFYAPLAMWMQIRSIGLLLAMYRRRRDPVLFAILPLGLASVGTYFLSGVVLLLSLPALLSTIPLT